MPARRLYRLPIPSDAQLDTRGSAQRQVRSLAPLDGAGSAVETGLGPGERLLRGQYRGRYADIMADDVEELFDAPAVGPVPYFGTDQTLAQDGYYLLENVSTAPAKPQAAGNLHDFDGILRFKGSRSTHWRAIKTAPRTVTNDFGSDNSSTDLGAPASATQVRWYNPTTSERTAAGAPTVTTTRSGEKGDVDIYDVDAAPYSTPVLIFSLAYADEGTRDVLAWDNRGTASKTDGSNRVQWANVYRPGHTYAGARVVENRLLRLTLDETNGIAAEEYTSGSWSSVSLGSSDWQLLDADLVRISPARVDAQLAFEDTTSTSTYTLDMSLKRGWDAVLFARTQAATSATPSGLQTLLDPIASETIKSPGATTSLVARTEARE